MSKATYVQKGESLDFKNTTGYKIEAGQIVGLTTRVGVAASDIGVSETGALHVVGVFSMPKESGVDISVGDAVYFDEDPSSLKVSKDDTKTPAGYAVADSIASSSEVLVKLLG